jgi:phosphohistidine phosphatase
MKKLILIRHATAEPEMILNQDFERKLEPFGIAEAKKLGGFMKTKKTLPEKVLSSSATRTRETSEYCLTEAGLDTTLLELFDELYNSGFQKILQKISAQEKEIEILGLVAHNPGISQVTTALAKTGNYQMPPAGAVCFSFDIKSWSEITAGTGKELWYFTP